MFRGFIFSGGKAVQENDPAEVVKTIKNKKHNVWIDLEDPTEAEIDFLIDEFSFHSLSIEDAILPHDHPKLELFDDYAFLTLYSVVYGKTIYPQEIDIFLGENFLITFHEEQLTSINKVMHRFVKIASGDDEAGNGSILRKGPDMLLHSVLSAVMDEYYPIIERLENNIALLEDNLLEDKEKHIMEGILEQKRNILIFRKFLYLERQVMGKMLREESTSISENSKTYFRDIFEHLVNMQETIEILREIIPSLIETYHSMTAKKLNQLIHRLTILATIAIPMTVITSFYGMNLQLPEFKWGIWGYIFMLCLLIFTSVGTYIVLKIKKWL
jgi:magnesium transporter